jgi:hypothetical protein
MHRDLLGRQLIFCTGGGGVASSSGSDEGNYL